MKWKGFDSLSWTALLDGLRRIIGMADANASAISGLGTDIADMAELTAASLGGKQDKSAAAEAVLSPDGWQCDEAGEYPYYCDIPAPGITAADRAEITLAPESLLTSVECGLCPTCETLAGAIRLRAALAPERELKVEYWMTQGKE